MFKSKVGLLAAAVVAFSSSAMADGHIHLKIQSVLNSTGSEVGYVRDFAEDVAALTDGRVTMEVLPGGSVVPNSDLIDAVDAGLIDGDLHGLTTGLVSTQQQCCLAHQSLELALVLIISHGFLGSTVRVVKSYMINYGTRWT